MAKKDTKRTAVFSYQVTMMVHIIEETADAARKKLDSEGGIVTQRDVEFLNCQPLYGEKENE